MKKGDKLTSLVKPELTRDQLRLYADASGDTNPIHLDEDVARKNGLPGVIVHGMITMAFFGELAHLILRENGGGRLGELTCRFKAMTRPGDVITLSATVRSVEGASVDCDFEARNQRDEVTATGQANLEFSSLLADSKNT